jgi:hypothetical protein
MRYKNTSFVFQWKREERSKNGRGNEQDAACKRVWSIIRKEGFNQKKYWESLLTQHEQQTHLPEDQKGNIQSHLFPQC